MRTRRRTYTSATLPSLVTVTKPIVQALAAVSCTKRGRKLQSCTAKAAKGKKKNKCNNIGGLWALLPLDLLREILSGLGLKANIQASVVCKAWCEAAVSVRKLQPPPLLFHYKHHTALPRDYVPHPLRFRPCKLELPGLPFPPKPTFSKDGWVLARKSESYYASTLVLNPFTRESFYLPPRRHEHRSRFLAFSAAPTSPSCMVISYTQLRSCGSVLIDTWRPGETEWTTHCFENQLPFRYWSKCVFSNGMFFCLSECGYLGVFDPSKATWNILPVKPCPAFYQFEFDYTHNPVFMTEHEGDIFVIYTHCYNNIPTVFKLNSKHKEWQEKTDLGGLTIYTSWPSSFVRAGLSTEHRNKIYSSRLDQFERYGLYYSLGDAKGSDPPRDHLATYHILWVEPPHNNFHLRFLYYLSDGLKLEWAIVDRLLFKHTQQVWINRFYFKYKKDRVSPNEVRNVLLVIAILIAKGLQQLIDPC
ncbi:unnamed protein product [Arabidopsis thaliana]|uniref:F-box domain-containing protein n=3 Tax=Arabidopsis TaxID=3701 RepID=A0A654F1Y4_ARATH|nr:unnamed protein product [Arabidopsis thaliana]